MPLSKARDKARKRVERATKIFVQPISNLNLVQPVQPNPVQPDKPKFQELQSLIRGIEEGSGYNVIPEEDSLPIYNPAIHRPGDRVLMKSPYNPKKLVETVIPEVDAEGNIIPWV